MQLSQEVTNLMGQKVDYVRIGVDEKGQPEPRYGKGIIVGVIVGVSRRIQIMVKDEIGEENKAYTLDLMCVNPSEEAVASYLEHHKKVRALVEQHNQDQKDREQAKIKEVDEINCEMFGPPLEV